MLESSFLQLASCTALLKLQSDNWQNRINFHLRFILCGIFSFVAYSIFEVLKGITIEQQNSLMIAMFGEPSAALLVFYIVFLGYLGLYCALIAAALFSSLLPRRD